MRGPNANYDGISELFATRYTGLRSNHDEEFEFDCGNITDLQILEPDAPVQSSPHGEKVSPGISFICSDDSKQDNMYAKLLSEDRMPLKVKVSKQASLTRYTWCVFEIFKHSKERTFKKYEIIDIVDSVGVCDQSKKDKQAMVKRLCRVLEVLAAIEVIEIDPASREFRLINNAKTKELLARPENLYHLIRRKRELCSSLAHKRDLKVQLDTRIDSLVKLIHRNKSQVSVGVLIPGTLSKFEAASTMESNRISLQGEIVRIPATNTF